MPKLARNRKLTPDDVRLIRALYSEYKAAMDAVRHQSPQRLADKFGVCQTTIEKVVTFETWRWVE